LGYTSFFCVPRYCLKIRALWELHSIRFNPSCLICLFGCGGQAVIALAGLTSIGWMAVVNLMINSDFKWLLLAFNLPWVIALFLSRRENKLATLKG